MIILLFDQTEICLWVYQSLFLDSEGNVYSVGHNELNNIPPFGETNFTLESKVPENKSMLCPPDLEFKLQ